MSKTLVRILNVDPVSFFPKVFEMLTEFPTWALLLFFGASNFLENVFPPWPGDSFTVFSGFLAARPESPLSLSAVIFSTLIGNWLGALVMFYFGEVLIHFLKKTKIPILHRLYEEESFQKTILWFRRYSGLVILGSRFSAGIRFFVAIVAGISKMNVIRFLFFYTIAISFWCGLLLWAGFEMGENWNQITVILSIYSEIISILLILLIALLFVFSFLKKKRTKLTS